MHVLFVGCISYLRSVLTISTIHILETNTYTPRTKHYAMRYNYIRQTINQHSIIFEYIPTQHHTADILTKNINFQTKLRFFSLSLWIVVNCELNIKKLVSFASLATRC